MRGGVGTAFGSQEDSVAKLQFGSCNNGLKNTKLAVDFMNADA